MEFGDRDTVMLRVGRMEQVASIRRYQLEDGKGRGMRAFEVTNGSGLCYTVYPDKGLDIGPAQFNGLPIAWMTCNGAVAPAFYDGSGFEWLRTWAGGLLTTCGWINVGPPCTTPEGENGLHGRMDHTPAEEVNTRCLWQDDGRYLMEISGTVAHCRVFGEKLVTTRTIRSYLGEPVIELRDRTENRGYETMPLMQLYHMNFGWPLIGEGTVLSAPDHPVTPQNAYCAEHLAEWAKMSAPIPGFAEQVFYHDLPADAAGMATMRIDNAPQGLAVEVSFRKRELPFLIQWKMMGQGEYVTGLEPANCYPEGQPANAQRGILRHIEPGETVETLIRVAVKAR
ncbi:MAG: aldose 1-epimerase family protein [Kiritimatiellae bacterium]|nr:aldose 1-epimerase family protein [Kiritimatiellia bacterium]